MNFWMLALALVTFQDVPDIRTIKVRVPAQAMPWDTGANPGLRLGLADGSRPARAIVSGLLPGLNITIKATGQVSSVQPQRVEWVGNNSFPQASYGPEGGDAWVVADLARYPRWSLPSTWADGTNGSTGYMELIGSFVDSDGKIIGKPFMIGRERKVIVPEGAVALSMGVNDIYFAENSGSFDVTVLVPRPKVTVE